MINDSNNSIQIQHHSQSRLIILIITLISFICIGIPCIMNSHNEFKHSNSNNNNHDLIKSPHDLSSIRNLFTMQNVDGFYSKMVFNDNYIGKWKRLTPFKSISDSFSGNVKIIFNLKLTANRQYDFNAKFIIYESSKAFINTFLFSTYNETQLNSTPMLMPVVPIYENDTLTVFQGNISALINDKQVFAKESENCKGRLSINFDHNNNYKITGSLITGDCSINLQYDVVLEDKMSKEKNINYYTTVLGIISISSIISQLSFAIQIEGNSQRSNSICLFVVAFNMIWTVYNIYSNFFLLYINIGYFYQFLLPMILFLFHFGCDMKVWIISIETKYNDTRFISILTFLALSMSFSSYFFGLAFYFNQYAIMIHMGCIWFPQIIYNVLYINVSMFPISHMIIVTMYRTFIPLYFCAKEFNFVDFDYDKSFIAIDIGILVISIAIIISQYVFGPRWFIPFDAYRFETHSLYKNMTEIIKAIPSAENLQCAICLNELLINRSVGLSKDFDYLDEWKKSIHCTHLSYTMTSSNNNNSKKVIKSKAKSLCSFIFCFNKRKDINRRDYMLTQCNHAFHSGCLELWLDFKKDCPNCRRVIS